MWILAAIIGLALGIAINVLADGLPPDEQSQHRSPLVPHCRVCRTPYPVAYWLALAHWITQRGRCPTCGASRSGRALLVEVAMAAGGAFLWDWAAGDVGQFYAALTVSFIFALMTVIDIEHRLILWRTVWLSAVVLIVIGAPTLGWQKMLLGGAAGYGIMLIFFLFGQLYEWLLARLRGKPLEEIAFGGGDVNLAGLVGLAVGWSGVLFALLIGIFTAALYGVGLIAQQLRRGRYSPHTPFAYGPFLVLGAMVMYLYGGEVAAWLLGPR